MTEHGILYQEYAKLEYGRLLWNDPTCARVFSAIGPIRATRAPNVSQNGAPKLKNFFPVHPTMNDALDRELRTRGFSLRVVVREIPSVFGEFF